MNIKVHANVLTTYANDPARGGYTGVLLKVQGGGLLKSGGAHPWGSGSTPFGKLFTAPVARLS